MTPQERQLIAELFDRLASLEREPRDRDAEKAISEGFDQAPNAAYALVQTVLVQDEALKQADARIRELTGETEPPRENRGFLDSMRDSLFGRHEERPGSVPRVRPGEQPMGVPPGYGSPQGGPSGGPWAGNPGMPQPHQQHPSGGGSFLGTAAAAAAGVIGGGLLLSGIRSMLGGQTQGPFAGTFDRLNPQPGQERAPFGGEPGGDLARQAGLEDIGRNPGYGALDNPRGDYDRPQPAGLFDSPGGEEGPGFDGPLDGDGGDFGGSDT